MKRFKQAMTVLLAGVLLCSGAAAEWICDAMPAQLQQITLTGRSLSLQAFHSALQAQFTLHPDFSLKNVQTVDDFYISAWADGCSALAGYDDRVITGGLQQLPEDDAQLSTLYGRCAAFLAELDIEAVQELGYICRRRQKGREVIIALLPYRIAGLATEYRNQLVNRDRLAYADVTAGHIMDAPWADFVFDSDGRLLKAELSLFRVAAAEPLEGQSIRWQQAADAVLAEVADAQVELQRQLGGRPEYDEAAFWAETRVELSHAAPMWMPNWRNECRPGWCVQYRLYDAATGELRCTAAYCADAVTWEVMR